MRRSAGSCSRCSHVLYIAVLLFQVWYRVAICDVQQNSNDHRVARFFARFLSTLVALHSFFCFNDCLSVVGEGLQSPAGYPGFKTALSENGLHPES